MDIKSIEFELVRLSELVSIGQFDEALNGIDMLYEFINEENKRDAVFSE